MYQSTSALNYPKEASWEQIIHNFTKQPYILAIVEKIPSLEEIIDWKKKGIQILELRFDALPVPFVESLELAKKLERENFSLLGTLRLKEAIEETPERIKQFSKILLYVGAIDIEYESSLKKEIISLAKTNNRIVILSSHNFRKTPSLEEMEEVYQEGIACHADIVKLAYQANSLEEVQRLLEFALKYKEEKNPRLVWISMGEWGKVSRLLAYFTNAPFTYAHLGKANALGQLSFEELSQTLALFHPLYLKK